MRSEVRFFFLHKCSICLNIGLTGQPMAPGKGEMKTSTVAICAYNYCHLYSYAELVAHLNQS